MISYNGEVLDINSFPDGTLMLKPKYYAFSVDIVWKYENDREFLALIYLVKHLRSRGADGIRLFMPYIPNARMDRVKNPEDVFTLKYFAELLNSLNFDEVEVLDPHSNVSEALINNLVVRTPEDCINRALNEIGVDCLVSYDAVDFNLPRKKYSLTMFYPDEGAMKRYSGMIALPYAFGIKKRDWETGQILGLDVAGEVDAIRGRDILIVDDICSRGGTFLHSAKKLKELGARDIFLYVSHCENTILEGELLTSGLVKRVFTTDSIFTKSHELIEVFKGVITK